MSSLRVTSLRGRTAGSAPTLPDGAVVTGVVTATSFAGNITGTTGTFTGNVSVGGTLTYDDVTRIDSVGIVTAGGGLYVGRTEGTGTGIGATVHTTGNAVFAGIVTASSYYGDASTMTNAGISAGKAVGLAAFLGC